MTLVFENCRAWFKCLGARDQGGRSSAGWGMEGMEECAVPSCPWKGVGVEGQAGRQGWV